MLLCGQSYDHVFKIADVSSDLPGLESSTLFKAEKEELHRLHAEKNTVIKLSIPYAKNKVFHTVLEEKQLYSPDYILSQKGDNANIEIEQSASGKYYSGTIVGATQSLVSLSIYEDRISGIIRYKDKTYNIGKYHKSDYHIIYKAEDLTEDLSFECESIEPRTQSIIEQRIEKTGTACNTALHIYFECDYAMYQNFNSNIVDVQNYVADIFNEMSTLYSNENIPILISEISVWTSNDPYVDNSSGLYDFKDELVANGFNGDVAQLLTNDPGSNGGIAYVDQLCGSFPYAYADINNSYNPYPTYSWDVQVVTHEIGHVLGSRHTHQCVWGPNNNQQIDDCGNIAAGGGGSCYNASSPIVPSAGGTIMSYCHTQSVGINFTEGFGTEPGGLIRQRHASCKCDNSTCNTATPITSDGIYFAHPNNGNGATSNNAVHADWFLFEPDSNGVVTIKSCGGGVDTRVWLYSGDCSNISFESYSDDSCDIGNGSNYASEISMYNVNAGTSYLIEWDNRWSSSSFNWEFIFVADTTPVLSITCPPDYVGSNLCNNTSHLPAITGTATSNDATASITYIDDIVPTNCQESIIRNWLVTDSNNVTASCNQVIEITDEEAPVIADCPSDITIQSNADCQYIYAIPEPTASDNCDATLLVASSNLLGDILPLGVHSIDYTYTDDCSNTAVCNFVITVEDGCTVLPPCNGLYVDVNGMIVDSVYHAKMELNADAMLMSGDSTIFKAGQTVSLNAGFEIQAGGAIEIMIEDCENN